MVVNILKWISCFHTTQRAKQGQHLLNRIDRILDSSKTKHIYIFFYVNVPEPDVWHLFVGASSLMFGVRFCAVETLKMESGCASVSPLLHHREKRVGELDRAGTGISETLEK